jgi:hypothetical protein
MRSHHVSNSRIKWNLTVIDMITTYSPNETKDIYSLFQRPVETQQIISLWAKYRFFKENPDGTN